VPSRNEFEHGSYVIDRTWVHAYSTSWLDKKGNRISSDEPTHCYGLVEDFPKNAIIGPGIRDHKAVVSTVPLLRGANIPISTDWVPTAASHLLLPVFVAS